MSEVPETTVQELHELLASSEAPLLIDVRTPAEFSSGHIDGAVNLPLNELPQRLPELNAASDRAIVTICRSAKRTIPATQFLHAQGFELATQLAGGMLAWHAAGLPTVR